MELVPPSDKSVFDCRFFIRLKSDHCLSISIKLLDLSKLLQVFLALFQANSSWSLTNKLKLVDWLKALNKVKGFNAMSSLCPWQRFISQRTEQVFTNEMPFESLTTSAIRSLQTFCCPGLSQMRGNKTKRQKQNPITWNLFDNEMQDNK